MLRPHFLLRALSIAGIVVTTPARAGSPDLRAAQNRLEDQLLEGDIDAEDFLAWHHVEAGASPHGPSPGAYLGVEAFIAERASGTAEWGALLVIELPLERFARVRTPQPPVLAAQSGSAGAWAIAGTAPAPTRVPLPTATGVGPESRHELPPISSGIVETAPRPERPPAAPVFAVTSEVARSCVRAALRAVGLADDQRLDSVASRARSSAALPELRLRAVRTLGESGRVSLSEEDPSRYVVSGAATNLLEARVTFRLDRLLFADEEVTVERVRLERSEERLRIAAKVLEALFAWQKAYAMLEDSTLSPEDRLSVALREAESCAILDMMTGGWFGAYRSALAARAR